MKIEFDKSAQPVEVPFNLKDCQPDGLYKVAGTEPGTTFRDAMRFCDGDRVWVHGFHAINLDQSWIAPVALPVRTHKFTRLPSGTTVKLTDTWTGDPCRNM